MGIGFARRHRADTAFWWLFALSAWMVVGLGFAAQIRLRFSGHADYPAPAVLVVHVWAFFGWITLLVMQVALASRGRLQMHRALGPLGLLYDLATRGSVHPVYRLAIPLLVAMQLVAVAIGQSEAWPDTGRRLLGIG